MVNWVTFLVRRVGDPSEGSKPPFQMGHIFRHEVTFFFKEVAFEASNTVSNKLRTNTLKNIKFYLNRF